MGRRGGREGGGRGGGREGGRVKQYGKFGWETAAWREEREIKRGEVEGSLIP